jgi:hypothetical protein
VARESKPCYLNESAREALCSALGEEREARGSVSTVIHPVVVLSGVASLTVSDVDTGFDHHTIIVVMMNEVDVSSGVKRRLPREL